MGKKTLEQAIREHQELGFDKGVIEIAYANVGGDSQRIIEEIFRLQNESQSYPTKPASANDEDAQLSKAIELSMNEAKDKKISLEPLNPEQRVRKSGVPVGLKNIGNTCYFNSLLQTYFQNTAFVREVLAYELPKRFRAVKDEDLPKLAQVEGDFKRKLCSCRLVEHLKALFCQLIASDRKYADPTPVLSVLVDDYGNELSIGDQKDIGEFNLVFLSRIEDGLEQGRKEKAMEIEGVKEEGEEGGSASKINMVGREQQGLLRRSSIRLHEKSVIGEQFIGKLENHFLNQTENISKTEEELFSLLFVNVKHKDLYKACEEVTVSHIDDYRNEKGEVIGVDKHTWIKDAPKTLFFQIDRVLYDKATFAAQKINDSFDFPTVFFIDPFLLKNRETALKLQKQVRSLRQRKEQLLGAIEAIERHGPRKTSLVELLGETQGFLQAQTSQMDIEEELQNPTSISALKSRISPQLLAVLGEYQQGLQTRVKAYRDQVSQLDKKIEQAYRDINKTPYYLYSLLIHEGSADTGHYYSYTYDLHAKKWRKYNDINVSEESQEQVLREGKGLNASSAYYLVYAQNDVLLPDDTKTPKLAYRTSNDPDYLADAYSLLLSNDQRGQMAAENAQMHLEIEQFKMNGYTTRVVDAYVKRFEAFNEIHRKTKIEKKKNTPPVLTSLPVYVKSFDEEEYKSLLIEQAVAQYGPKEPSNVFQEVLRKKLSNFHDFKRPKKLYCNGKHVETFVRSYYCAIATRKLFECIEHEQYRPLFALIRPLLATDPQDYFNWLGRLLTKIFVVRLFAEAEREVRGAPGAAVERLRMAAVLLGKYVNVEEERMLHLNAIYWGNQIMVDSGDARKEIEDILAVIDSKYENQFSVLQQRAAGDFQQIVKSVDLNDAQWNSSRQQNTVVDTMLQYRERVKGKFQICNKLYVEMKKFSYPLKKEERDRFLKQ